MAFFCKFFSKLILLPALMLIFPVAELTARDYLVTGRVTDPDGTLIPNAKVSFVAGTREYAATSRPDGFYSVRISGIYDNISGLIETGIPYPNPFSNSVNVPFIINKGDIRFTVYNFSGQKIREITFGAVEPGSYQIVWDGCSQNGEPQPQGLYIYAITFMGKTRSGKLIKAAGFSSYSAGTALEPVMLPPLTPPPAGKLRIPVITSVTCQDYYPLRLTDITIAQDTVINFEITLKQQMPFKTTTDNIAMHTGDNYRSLVLKGINLGSSPPGTFPGEIAYLSVPHCMKNG
jgi:hypothetical protein